MGKKFKINICFFLRITQGALVVLLVISILFGKKQENVFENNFDSESVASSKVLSGITSLRDMTIVFPELDINTKKINIYMKISGEEDIGNLNVLLKNNSGLLLDEFSIELSEIEEYAEEMQQITIDLTSLKDIPETLVVTLVGNGVSKNVKVQLYAIKNRMTDFLIESGIQYMYYEPMYQLVKDDLTYPYVWDLLVLLVFVEIIKVVNIHSTWNKEEINK